MPIDRKRPKKLVGRESEGVKVVAGRQRREIRGLDARRAGGRGPEKIGTGSAATRAGDPVTMVAETREQEEREG